MNQHFKTVTFRNIKRRTNACLWCIIRSWKRGEPRKKTNLIYRKEVFIMKKSTKVLFNAYKVIFALTAIALIVTYVRGLISPTATNAVISGNDWFTLGYMSVVYMLITEKEKNAKLLNTENN